MADKVQRELELIVPVLQDLEDSQIFSFDEIRSIIRRKREFEYRLARKDVNFEDYLNYLHYEMSLDKFINLRVRACKRKGKRFNKFLRSQLDVLEKQYQAHLKRLFRRGVRRFGGEIRLWFAYAEFCANGKCCSSGNAKSHCLKILAEALRRHAYNWQLWALCTDILFRKGSLHACRLLLLKALRVINDAAPIWSRLLLLEKTALLLQIASSDFQNVELGKLKNADDLCRNYIEVGPPNCSVNDNHHRNEENNNNNFCMEDYKTTNENINKSLGADGIITVAKNGFSKLGADDRAVFLVSVLRTCLELQAIQYSSKIRNMKTLVYNVSTLLNIAATEHPIFAIYSMKIKLFSCALNVFSSSAHCYSLYNELIQKLARTKNSNSCATSCMVDNVGKRTTRCDFEDSKNLIMLINDEYNQRILSIVNDILNDSNANKLAFAMFFMQVLNQNVLHHHCNFPVEDSTNWTQELTYNKNDGINHDEEGSNDTVKSIPVVQSQINLDNSTDSELYNFLRKAYQFLNYLNLRICVNDNMSEVKKGNVFFIQEKGESFDNGIILNNYMNYIKNDKIGRDIHDLERNFIISCFLCSRYIPKESKRMRISGKFNEKYRDQQATGVTKTLNVENKDIFVLNSILNEHHIHLFVLFALWRGNGFIDADKLIKTSVKVTPHMTINSVYTYIREIYETKEYNDKEKLYILCSNMNNRLHVNNRNELELFFVGILCKMLNILIQTINENNDDNKIESNNCEIVVSYIESFVCLCMYIAYKFINQSDIFMHIVYICWFIVKSSIFSHSSQVSIRLFLLLTWIQMKSRNFLRNLEYQSSGEDETENSKVCFTEDIAEICSFYHPKLALSLEEINQLIGRLNRNKSTYPYSLLRCVVEDCLCLYINDQENIANNVNKTELVEKLFCMFLDYVEDNEREAEEIIFIYLKVRFRQMWEVANARKSNDHHLEFDLYCRSIVTEDKTTSNLFMKMNNKNKELLKRSTINFYLKNRISYIKQCLSYHIGDLGFATEKYNEQCNDRRMATNQNELKTNSLYDVTKFLILQVDKIWQLMNHFVKNGGQTALEQLYRLSNFLLLACKQTNDHSHELNMHFATNLNIWGNFKYFSLNSIGSKYVSDIPVIHSNTLLNKIIAKIQLDCKFFLS